MFNKLQYLLTYLCIITAIITVMGLPCTAQSGPASQSVPVNPARAGAVTTPAVAQPAGTSSQEERIIRLEERVNLANERSENAYKFLQVVGVFAAGMLAFFTIRDVVLRTKEGERQRSIDKIVMDMMNLQKTAFDQQVRFGKLHLDHAEASPSQQFEAVAKVNQVIEVVRQTLNFRLEQEAVVAGVLGEIGRIKEERERTRNQKLTQAIAILEPFKDMSRMQFAALTNEQYRRGLRLVGLVNDLDEFLAKQDFKVVGSLLYNCGVIAYYDNDVIEAKAYLDRAAQCRASDHEGELATNNKYLNRFAFIHYFRALIHKNWGNLSEAQHEIEQSAKLIGDQAGEFLTPVTKAEILSYTVGDEERCRAELQKLIKRINDLETGLKNKGAKLNANQERLRNRMLVLWGNTHFEQDAFREALV